LTAVDDKSQSRAPLKIVVNGEDYDTEAETLEDLGQLRSVGLHKLTGDRKGQWAITVNGPWRICFHWVDGDAHDVEIVDYN